MLGASALQGDPYHREVAAGLPEAPSYGLTNRLAERVTLHATALKLQQLVGHIRAIAAPAPPPNTEFGVELREVQNGRYSLRGSIYKTTQ
jgi:hypothetical protein